jgi:hypothetical protein
MMSTDLFVHKHGAIEHIKYTKSGLTQILEKPLSYILFVLWAYGELLLGL